MRKITLFLAMLFAFVGWQTANAQVNGEVELTFNRDGQNVTVNSNNAAVTAEFVGITGASFRTPDANNRTSAVLCPDKNANSCNVDEFNVALKFKITGFTTIEKIGLTILGLNAGGGYQNADSYVRTWQLDCGLSDTEDGTPTTFATFNQNVTGSVHNINSEKISPAIETAEDGTYLTITINNSQNQYGCFIGLSAIRLTPEVSTAQVTYNYQLNGVTKKSVTVEQGIGTAYAAPAIDYVTFTQPAGTVPAEGATVNVECAQNLPFTVSESFEAATWYFMTIRSNNEKYVSRSESTPYNNSATITTDDNGLWAFMGNVFDGIQLINKGAGNGQTLGFDAASDGSAIYMKDGNTSWTIEEGNGGFLLRQEGENQYAHDLNNTLKFWVSASAASDAGSAFKVYLVTERLETLLQDWKESTTTCLGYVGGYPATMSEAINAVSTYADALAFDEANATSKIALTAGYYFIKGTGSGNDTNWYASYGSNNSDFMAAALGDGEKLSAKHVWSFDAIEGEDGYKLKACNLGAYAQLAAAPATSQIASDYDMGYKFVFTDNGFGKFTIKDGNDNIMRTENGGQINTWNTESSETWYIIPATELEISLNNAQGVYWSTTYLPFNVTLNDNVEAYYVSTFDDVNITLSPAGNVPAGNAVVLRSESDATVTLNITSEDVNTNIANNKLAGFYVATAKPENALVLGAIDGIVGFYPTSLETLTANRAYLINSNESSLTFKFDNGTTAIDEIPSENTENNAAIFDLSGRRVLNPTKGIYIKGGKKIYFN